MVDLAGKASHEVGLSQRLKGEIRQKTEVCKITYQGRLTRFHANLRKQRNPGLDLSRAFSLQECTIDE